MIGKVFHAKPFGRTSDQGFSLIEILIAVLILTLAIVPIINAIGPAITATASEEETLVFANQARATLNRLLTLDFETLDDNQGDSVALISLFGSAAEAGKEMFMRNGKSYTPTVAITDSSGGTGGLLQLTVTINHVRLTTLKADY